MQLIQYRVDFCTNRYESLVQCTPLHHQISNFYLLVHLIEKQYLTIFLLCSVLFGLRYLIYFFRVLVLCICPELLLIHFTIFFEADYHLFLLFSISQTINPLFKNYDLNLIFTASIYIKPQKLNKKCKF